jgi:hypothetical protein
MAAMLIIEATAAGYRIRCAQCPQGNPVVWEVRDPHQVLILATIDAAIEHGTAQHQNIAETIKKSSRRIEMGR